MNIEPIYLPINRKSKDFQLVHLDALNGYGIALKFNFSSSNNSFKIVDGKLIKAYKKGPIEYKINIDNQFRAINNPQLEYSFQIDIECTQEPFEEGQFSNTNSESGDNYKVSIANSKGYVTKEFLIDLHIINKESVKRADIKIEDLVKWGTEFCKFYII